MDTTASRLVRNSLHAGWIAPVWFALVVWLAGRREGYATALRAMAELGAPDAPHALWFNLAGFIVTGLLLLGFAMALEAAMARAGAGRGGRLGTGLLMVSALAIAAQGVFVFDPSEPDGAASQRHASALAFALLGLMAGAMFVAASVRRLPGWQALALLGPALAALLLLFLAQPPQSWLPALEGRAGHAQRLVLAVYFLWFALASLIALARQRARRAHG